MAIAAHHPLTNCQPASRSSVAPFTGLADWLDRTLQLWSTRISERRALELMDERGLRDAGLSRWSAEREIARPFWRG